MNLSDIAAMRLGSQQLAGTQLTSPRQLISLMGAIQAQDADMCKWAIGARLPGCALQMVNDALDNGDIIRTHVLRPTWHLVARDDIYRMLQLTGPQVAAAMRFNDKKLGLTETIFSKINTLIANALQGGKHLTRDEIFARFKDAGIDTTENRSSHLLMRAEIRGIICSGRQKGVHRTYTLLEELVPKPAALTKDESLAKLAKTYFTSRGPATLNDFIWWSGLPVTDARHALEMVKEQFIFETVSGQTYWFSANIAIPAIPPFSLLPAFDEYLIAYADRSASIALKHHPRAFSSNGIFWPVMATKGQVSGLWKRTVKKDTVIVETGFFNKIAKTMEPKVLKAARAYAKFLGKKLDLRINMEHI